jgi:hypothetical protein
VSPRALAPGTALVPGNSPDNGLSRGKLRPAGQQSAPALGLAAGDAVRAPDRVGHWPARDGLAAEAGQLAEEVAEDQRRGRYLDAREALDYGLIDGIRITR